MRTGPKRAKRLRVLVRNICDKCKPQLILSYSFIGHTYEISTCFIFTMRVLELGLKSCQKFCELMDMPQFLFQNTYNAIVNNMHNCIKEVSNKLFKNVVDEEKKKLVKKEILKK